MRYRAKNKSTLKREIEKTDRLLQDFYRTKRLDCEVCGKGANLVHHFIEKSKSSYLRYEPKNLIPLCFRCHSRHHLSGDPQVIITIVEKQGKRWWNWLQKKRGIKKKWTLEELKKLQQNFRTPVKIKT